MARPARQKSASDIYHIMVRGINKQDIFINTADRARYLRVLRECKEISGFTLYAYCLMSNHVHLLIKAGEEPLDLVMKRIGTRYAAWFNKRHARVGHLFQDRFRSEIVEDDCYFLTVLRYIIQNPMKAGLEQAPGHYPWSSYKAYAQGQGEITDIAFATTLCGGREKVIQFLKASNTDLAMDMPDRNEAVDDEIAYRLFPEITGCKTPADFQALGQSRQWRLICELKNAGLCGKQISQLTGRSKSTVSTILKREL